VFVELLLLFLLLVVSVCIVFGEYCGHCGGHKKEQFFVDVSIPHCAFSRYGVHFLTHKICETNSINSLGDLSRFIGT
jgi:hypothetical protein